VSPPKNFSRKIFYDILFYDILLTGSLLVALLQYCYTIFPKAGAIGKSCYGKKSTSVKVTPGPANLPIPTDPVS
jgi:hypothetical protein